MTREYVCVCIVCVPLCCIVYAAIVWNPVVALLLRGCEYAVGGDQQARLRFASTGAASVLAVALVLFLASGPADSSSTGLAKTQGLNSVARSTQLPEEVGEVRCLP